MKISRIIVLALAATLVVAQGCATKRGTGAVTGGAVGAAAGAAVGDDKEAAAIGGLLGAIVGSEIGRRMDEADRRRTSYALESNKTGQASTWTNPDTGDRYRVTPTETYTRSGSPCREFVIVREANGRDYESRETACRQSDGSWRIVS